MHPDAHPTDLLEGMSLSALKTWAKPSYLSKCNGVCYAQILLARYYLDQSNHHELIKYLGYMIKNPNFSHEIWLLKLSLQQKNKLNLLSVDIKKKIFIPCNDTLVEGLFALWFSGIIKLDLSQGSILPENMLHLAEALKINTTLNQLNLMLNNLTSEAVLHLAEALKNNTTLKQLNLGVNHLGSKTASYFAEVLKINTTLTQLGLETNNLGSEGALHLAEVLKINTTLNQLNLKYNNLKLESALHLAEALKINTTLTQLDLDGNNLDLVEIKCLLARNRCIEALKQGENTLKEIITWTKNKYGDNDPINEHIDIAILQEVYKTIYIKKFFSACTFSGMVLFTDGYFKIKDNIKPNDNRVRFFKITEQLPMELQMVVSNRAYELNKELIPQKDIEKGLKFVINNRR